MKKRFGIFLAVIVLLLVLTVAVACDPKDKAPSAQKYEIKFESNGGSLVQSIVADAGSDISSLLPAEPLKDGVFFGGWSLENNGFASEVSDLPTVMPEANVTYYARWTRHAIVVPKLQPLNDKGEPDSDKANYVASPENSITLEVDPQNPVLDMNNEGSRPAVKGYRLSGGQEYIVTIDGKEKTISLNFDRASYNISFNLNNNEVSGSITGARKYFGQKLELPDLPNNVEVPVFLRLSGWSTDYDGEKDFAAAGDEIEIGEEGGLVDGSVPSITLYAVYDEAYIDFSRGQDCVFIPKHEKGVAYVRRILQDISGDVLFAEFEGDYISNPSVSESSPHLGLFYIENEAGTTLNGYVYADGHFAYEQTSFDPNWKGVELANFSLEQNQIVADNKLTIIDLYGCAALELASPVSTFVITNGGLETYTLEAGKHVGGYWYDIDLEDYCFSIFDDIEGESYQIDFHFQYVEYPPTPDEIYFAFAGKESGIYCDSILPNNTLDGDILILNGYDEAIGLVGDSQYTGQYFRVGENTFLVDLYNSSNEFYSILFRADPSNIEGANSSGTFIRYYEEKGDGALFVQCANADGSAFYSDGFGNAVYTTNDGKEISGEAEIVGESFESSTPTVLFKLTESGGAAHYFILDYFITQNNGLDAHFTHFTTESAVDIKYLYSTSEKAGEYVGALVTAGSDAYYLTAVATSSGNVIFSDLNKGTVSSKDGGYLYSSPEYIISYEDDEVRTMRYETPTVTTSQMKLGELTFSVVGDDGKEVGKLNITGGEDGKATYDAQQGGFTAADHEFAYSSIIVKQGQDVTMFVVDEFGLAPKAYATVKKNFLAAATEEPQGELYIFKQGGKESAMLWMLMYDEMHFYAVADISVDNEAAFKPINGNTVYLIDTPFVSYNAIKTENGDYLAPNTTLRSGTFTIYDANTDKAGTDKLQLDTYGAAKYTQGTKTFEGSYEVVDGVYSATFKGQGAPAAFKFMLSSTYFMKVDYSEFYVVDPATLGVNSLLRIQSGTSDTLEGKTAELFRAREGSNGNVSVSSEPVATGKITSQGDGIYQFSGRSDEKAENDDTVFTFRFDEDIFTQKVLVRNNVTLPTGEYKEDASDAQSKKVTLDEYGKATYFDGSKERKGFYFIDGGIYRFVDDNDRELYLQFTLNEAEKRLIIYGAEAKPFEGGEYDLTYSGEQYKLSISVNGKTLKAILMKDGTAVATDEELEVDDDGVYTFVGDGKNLKFIISKGKIVLYNSDLDDTVDIYVGNMWLLKERSIIAFGNDYTATITGQLVVKGFYEVAEIKVNNSAETIKGSISAQKDTNYDIITFTDEYGSTQEFYYITYSDRTAQRNALFVEGTEKGRAIEYYYTMGTFGKALAYFDGLGKAYKLDGNDKPTDEVIGYYFFDSYDLIYVGTLNTSGTEFTTSAIYASYGLRITQLDGSSENVMGVVAYNAKYDAIAIADDGSIFIFDGFDAVYYVDSSGVAHTGYFNNYGEMYYGTPDGRYLIIDEYDNATLYFIDFVEGGGDGKSVKARRASYVVYAPYTNVYAEVQFMSATDYKKPDGETELPDNVPEDKQGFAFFILVIDGEQGTYQGFYTIEGGIMTIEVIGQDGKSTGDHIELALYVDGTADWNNYSEWLTSSAE